MAFKDRNLLVGHEYLDLASGPPLSEHRTSPRSKRSQMLDAIQKEDRTKLSGQHMPKLDFAAGARATGSLIKDTPNGVKESRSPVKQSSVHTKQSASPDVKAGKRQHPADLPHLNLDGARASGVPSMVYASPGPKTPALTGRRPPISADIPSDVAKMSVDEVLAAIEHFDLSRSAPSQMSLETEEIYIKKALALRKELQSLVATGKLISLRHLAVSPGSVKQVVVFMTPNGSTRPHISTKAKRADSRMFIKLVDFDRSKMSAASSTDLPIRDLIIRSLCVRSDLEVQQSNINFGTCERGEVKSKTIVIQVSAICRTSHRPLR